VEQYRAEVGNSGRWIWSSEAGWMRQGFDVVRSAIITLYYLYNTLIRSFSEVNSHIKIALSASLDVCRSLTL